MTDLAGSPPPVDDGGHDAIKGFAYQFDKTLLEIFQSPRQRLEIEGAQDLSGEHYHMQIKNRSGKFYPSVIAKAVRRMFLQFMSNRDAAYILHCHFADQPPGTSRLLTLDELNGLFSGQFSEVEQDLKLQFSKSFCINFSEDYETQFKNVLQYIATGLGAKDSVEALSYHAILHAYLRNLVLTEPSGRRWVALNDLKKAVADARSAIFTSTYVLHCGYEKYLKMVRRQYLPRRVNVPNLERIFSFECTGDTRPEDIAEAVLTICERYRIAESSPTPYFTFRGEFDESSIKANLWEAGAYFNDGRGYHGGAFKMEILTDPPFGAARLKIVEQDKLLDLMAEVAIKEFHDFFLIEKLDSPVAVPRPHHVFLQSHGDLMEVFR
ncbi:hypothetical protein KVH22_06375 [Streptomyces olivaceus]|uniref:hypothetical protein n=1 Tax=Streptomyces olivaceus TaxID=47716 RepID=UPI001CCC3CE0|nr:hypothetical protein [Streptomyces olivaceus]MBZ6255190.1 hypothetical protein [Streptomyces olivaceus]